MQATQVDTQPIMDACQNHTEMAPKGMITTPRWDTMMLVVLEEHLMLRLVLGTSGLKRRASDSIKVK